MMPSELLTQWLDLSQHSPLLLAVFDQHDTLQYANTAFRRAYGLDEQAMPSWPQLIRDNYRQRQGVRIMAPDLEAWLASATSRRGKSAWRAFESDLHDGRWIWMTETVNAAGWMLCVACDITALRADDRALRESRDLAVRAAQTDELTGISNRRHILQQLELALQPPQPDGCILILDLDHFKQINDRHGHPFGDAVLRDFARRTQRRLRRADGFGRLGGEEFMVLLQQVSLDEAAAIAAQLLADTRQPRAMLTAGDFVYTCSAGLSALRAGDTLSCVYARADAALYQAKQQGRDRVVCAG